MLLMHVGSSQNIITKKNFFKETTQLLTAAEAIHNLFVEGMVEGHH